MHLQSLSFSLLAAAAFWGLGAVASPDPATSAPIAHPQHHGTNPQYSLQSLHGRHGFTYQGTLAGLGPIASSGRVQFDGQGNMTAEYTTNVNGTTFTGTFLGTYTMNPTGTGSVTINLPVAGVQAHGDFVLVDHGDATFFTATDQGFSVVGSTREM